MINSKYFSFFIKRQFFLGNSVNVKSYDNYEEAAKDLLQRDHPKILELLKDFDNANLGSYFVPPDFISDIPEVILPEEYEALFACKNKGM